MILNQYIKEYNLRIKNNKNINDLNIILKRERKTESDNEETKVSLFSLFVFFSLSGLFSYYYIGLLYENNRYIDFLYLFICFFIMSFFISFYSNKNIFQNLISSFLISLIPIIPYSYFITSFLMFPLIFILIKKDYMKKTKTKAIEDEIKACHYKIEVNNNKMSSLIHSISTDPDSLHFLENSEYRDFNNNVKKEIYDYLINNKKSNLVDTYIKQHSVTSIYND